MIKRILVVAGLAIVAGIGYIAVPSAIAATQNTAAATEKAKEAPALIDVKVCPVTKEAVHGEGASSEVVGKYKVYFCCKGCIGAFAKLSPEQKLKKAEEAYAVQQEQQKEGSDKSDKKDAHKHHSH